MLRHWAESSAKPRFQLNGLDCMLCNNLGEIEDSVGVTEGFLGEKRISI